MVYVKIHKSIVAVCDEELIGKEFKEGKLSLKVSERFYKGEKKSEEEVKDIIMNATNLNIVGKKSIKIALDLGIINKDSIITIKDIPHAQIISF